MPSDLAPHLARMLWFYQMGMVLFWIYDRSAHQKRSRELLKASIGVVVLLIKLSNVPLFGPHDESCWIFWRLSKDEVETDALA